MKKKREQHHRPASFTKEGVATAFSHERALTAEGYQRRVTGACPTRSLSLYRGRRQGKGK